MYFELTSPIRFSRTPAKGPNYSLGIYFGRDNIDQKGLPFYHRGGNLVDLRWLGWVLTMSLPGGTDYVDPKEQFLKKEDAATAWLDMAARKEADAPAR